MLLKIFTLNMWLLPFRFSKDNKKRLKALTEYISKNNIDFIALQEVWQTKYIRYLEKKLKKYYFSHNAGPLINKSGLVIISKKKPYKARFYPFFKYKFMQKIEKLVTKGVLVANFKEYDVATTHLYRPVISFENIVLAQELKFVKKHMSTKKITFLCADLNLTKQKFRALNNDFFHYAEGIHNTVSDQNKYSNKWWEKRIIPNKKIDYILVRDPTKKKIKYKSAVVDNELSDHYGIVSEVKLI